MSSVHHTGLPGDELHVNKVYRVTGTELSESTRDILDARYFGPGGQAVTPVTGATPTDTINGLNTIFALVSAPLADLIRDFLNGVRLKPRVGNDYTESTSNIVLSPAP